MIEIKTIGSSARAFLHSLGELLELLRDGAAAELIVVAEHPLARSLRGDAAEDHAVQQRVAAKTVVAVHAAGNLASRVQARDGLALLVQHGGVAVDLKATHAVVDHGCDDGDIEGLALHSAARDHIVVELLAAARLAADLVPRLARGVCGPAATVGVLLRFLGGLVVRLVRLLEDRHRNAHIRSQSGTTVVVLHDTTAGVVLAMPDDLLRGGLVQAQAEGRFVLPHLARDIVAAAELVRDALAVGVQHQAANAAERLSSQELDLRIRVVGLHQARGVHLDPLQVDGLAADGLAHLDAVARAVLAVGRRQVHQVRPVLRQQGVLREVSAEATGGQDHRAVLLLVLAALLVGQAHAAARGRVHQQGVGARLRDDAGTVRLLRDLLEHLDQGIGDGHAREALRAAVRARHGVSAQACEQRQVQVELLHQPVNVGTAVAAEHLHDLRALGATLQRVRGEERNGVVDALGLLCLRLSAVDAARGLRGVAAAEGRLVQQDDASAVFKQGVRCRHAGQATT
mmetsp:Transcript_13802/g.36924  ORF Transcript_13802/g.36924 Transcript_13802/m.36924 type:complete len:514 (-) Transcript_13802:112-1653(-)